MTAYVAAGYIAVFGSLGVYAYRLVLRTREVAAQVLAAQQTQPGQPGSDRREPGSDRRGALGEAE